MTEIFSTLLIVIIISIGLYLAFTYQKEGSELNKINVLFKTDDLRITSSAYSYAVYNINSGSYDSCNFSRTEDGRILLKLRYSYPKNSYYNIMTLGNHSESRITHYKIINKELKPYELNIKIRNFLFSHFSLNIEIKDNQQYEKLIKIFC